MVASFDLLCLQVIYTDNQVQWFDMKRLVGAYTGKNGFRTKEGIVRLTSPQRTNAVFRKAKRRRSSFGEILEDDGGFGELEENDEDNLTSRASDAPTDDPAPEALTVADAAPTTNTAVVYAVETTTITSADTAPSATISTTTADTAATTAKDDTHLPPQNHPEAEDVHVEGDENKDNGNSTGSNVDEVATSAALTTATTPSTTPAPITTTTTITAAPPPSDFFSITSTPTKRQPKTNLRFQDPNWLLF